MSTNDQQTGASVQARFNQATGRIELADPAGNVLAALSGTEASSLNFAIEHELMELRRWRRQANG